MRTLAEILSAAKVGEPTTHVECLYALLAMDSLSTFDHMDTRRLVTHPKYWTPEQCMEEQFRRSKTALGKSPRDWLGPNNDPANPEVSERVRAARRLLDLVIAQRGDKP